MALSRLIRRPVAIQMWVGEEPRSFLDGDCVHQIQTVLDRWEEAGNWWEGEGSRLLLRVMTDQNALFDLERDGRDWYIYRVWD